MSWSKNVLKLDMLHVYDIYVIYFYAHRYMDLLPLHWMKMIHSKDTLARKCVKIQIYTFYYERLKLIFTLFVFQRR